VILSAFECILRKDYVVVVVVVVNIIRSNAEDDCLSLLLRIQEILSSNFCADIGYPD
jgi:hypothetical protein